MINTIHSASGSSAAQPKAPVFRETDAVCIEIPKSGQQQQPSNMPRHSARDRLAQLTYFAQSIAQAMPAMRPNAANLARYANQTPRFSFCV